MLPFDTPLFLWLNADPNAAAWIVALARAVSRGESIGLLVLLALGAGMAPHRAWRLGATSFLALGLAWCAVTLLRHGIPTQRPAYWGLGTQWVSHSTNASFPSMHTTTAFAFALALWSAGCHRAITWLALVFAATIGWSRVCLGLHFPADILGGAVVGAACAALAHRSQPLWLKWHGRFSAYWSRLAPPWARRK